MNKKRIVWATVVVILVVIFGILPKVLGGLAHEKILEQARTVSDMPGYALTVKDYDQGWFTSRAVISYGFDEHTLEGLKKSEKGNEMNKSLLELLSKGVEFNTEIAHGPVTFKNGIHFALYTVHGKLADFENEDYENFRKKAKVDSLITVDTVVSYVGNVNATLTSPDFKAAFTNKNGSRLDIESGGLKAEVEFDAALTHYTTSGKLAAFTVESDGEMLWIDDFTYAASGEKLNDYLWLGEGRTNINGFGVDSKKGGVLESKKLSTTYTSRRPNDTAIDFDLIIQAQKLTIPTAEAAGFGKSLVITDINADLSLGNLDIAALTNYIKGVQESSAALYATDDEADQQAQAAEVARVINEAGKRLLLGSPRLDIRDLDFKFDGGSFESDGTLKLNAEGLTDTAVLAVPAQLTKRLDLDATARFDQALAEAFVIMGMKKQMAASGMDLSALPPEQLKEAVSVQTSLMLQVYVQQGLIVAGEKENTFQSHIQIKDGQQLINGKAIQLPMTQ